jgi:pimeloyl-ACP methyl ester carboxylesterase
MVLLDGIAARSDRNDAFEELVQNKDQTIISVFLTGQGETLARALERGSGSLENDISADDQAKTLVETLDALGIEKPVGVLGLSYGGAIAAEAKKRYPDRFDKLLLLSSYVRSPAKSMPFYDLVMHNPFNPLGPMMYRTLAKEALTQHFNEVPQVLSGAADAFHEALFRMSMGVEDFELDRTLNGLENVHMLVVANDPMTSADAQARSFRGAGTGSFTRAPSTDDGQHDLLRGDGQLAASWAADVMAGRIPSKKVTELRQAGGFA